MSPWPRSCLLCAPRAISPNGRRAPISPRRSAPPTGQVSDSPPPKATSCPIRGRKDVRLREAGVFDDISGSMVVIGMAKAIRRSGVRRVPLSEIKDDLSRFLREAEGEEIVITRNGKPAGVLIGFGSEDDWLDYRPQKHPRLFGRL